MSGDRTKFKYQSKLIFGLHPEGILEIKIHNPKSNNAIFERAMIMLAEILEQASKSKSIKCIVIHGGKIFCTGNDVAAFEIGREINADLEKYVARILHDGLNRLLTALFYCKKPIIGLVRGYAIGLGFTMLSLFDFVYCTPEARFSTPFMQSFQSPEGTSTLNFPIIFGPRKANEVLLLDTMIGAKEALEANFINGILTDIPSDQGEWPDLMKIPCIPKLLQSEVSTLKRAKSLLIEGQGKEVFEATLQRESEALKHIWLSPEFPDRMMAYLMQVQVRSGWPFRFIKRGYEVAKPEVNKQKPEGPKL